MALQCCWRRKLARRELRRRRTEAREAGKLLQDKQALDEKLKETVAVLETVQNQRNELRQAYKAGSPPVLSCPVLSGPEMPGCILTFCKANALSPCRRRRRPGRLQRDRWQLQGGRVRRPCER